MIGAYNQVLHEAVIDALVRERDDALEALALITSNEIGDYRERIGFLRGLSEAMIIAEETRKRMTER